MTQPQDMTPAISVRSLVKTFGRGAEMITALNNVSVDIRQNEFFTLLGPSGCGKTTLLRLIAGFELPDQGEVLLHGQEIAHLPPHKRPVNTVFQNYALFPHLNVSRNIAFGLEMQGWDKAKVTATVERMLELVKDMQLELKRLQDETGITFVFVTHDQEEALTMSDRIAVMSNGLIQQVGTPHDIYYAPETRFVADFIGDINIIHGEVNSTSDGNMQVTLAGDLEMTLPGTAPMGQSVSVAIRPERSHFAVVGAPDTLPARVTDIVFFGAGTNIHLTLNNGQGFIVRIQGQENGCKPGDVVAIAIDRDAAKVLDN